ncbi:hypothetical protein [Formosa sp. S-31]|uniref:hypothetical protein n=1 Tax=Formosa sp. S-31 TaxID=2790949 RepID=UPI003EC094BD
MKIKLFCFLCLTLSILSCGNDKKNLPENFDFGQTENNVYSNPYFGLSIKYPENWTPQSKRNIKAITASGEQILIEDNKPMASDIKAAQINTAYLFSLFNQPLEKASSYNASLNVVAENITAMPHIKRGRDYLLHSKNLLLQSRVPYKFDSNLDTKEIDGYTFDIMRSTADFGPYRVKQEFFCIIRYGFSLSFVLSYTNDVEKQELYNAINTITLD